MKSIISLLARRGSPLKWCLFVGILCGVFAATAGTAAAFQMDAEWIDASQIKVNRVQIDNGDAVFSDETNQHGVGAVSGWVNNQIGNGKIFTMPDLLEIAPGSREFVYKLGTCAASSTFGFGPATVRREGDFAAIDFGGDGFNGGGSADFPLGILPFRVEGDARNDCHFVTGGRPPYPNYNKPVQIAKAERHNIWFKATGPDTLVRVDGKDGIFKRGTDAGNQNKFFRDVKAGNCPTTGAYVEVGDGKIDGGIVSGAYETCDRPGRFNISVAGLQDVAANPQMGGGNGNASDLELECAWSLNPLTWLMCPIIKALSETVTKLDAAILEQLTVDTNKYFNENDGDVGSAFYSAWNSFRVIALALLVVIGLIMIMAQALSFDFVDAYTIKKVVPRIVVAILLVSVSWPLTRFAVDISNHLGHGIRSIIYSPFASFPAPSISGGTSSIAFGGVVITGSLLGIIGILSFGLTALMAVLIAFTMLIIRKMLIILLIITAPVAIVAYILPNTQKVWDIWRKYFISALVVFVIIEGFIAIGRVFAIIIARTGSGGLIEEVIMFVSYIGGYAATGTAFRLAGGAIANISGMVNDRSRGAFDRLKKYRQGRSAQNIQAMKTGERWSKNNMLGRAANRTTGEAYTFGKAESKWSYLTDQRVRNAARAEQNTINQMDHAKSGRGQAAQHNDPLLRAQSFEDEADTRANYAQRWNAYTEQEGGRYVREVDRNGIESFRLAQAGETGNFDEDTEAIEDAIASAKANGGWSKQRQEYAARRLFATGTGYDNIQQAMSTIAGVTKGNKALARAIYGEGNSTTKGVGRHDLAISFGQYDKLYDTAAEDLRNGGAGHISENQVHQAYLAAIEGTDAVGLQRDKKTSAQNLAPILQNEFNAAQAIINNPASSEADRTAAEIRVSRMSGIIENIQNSAMYAAPQNIRVYDEQAAQPTSGDQYIGFTEGGEVRMHDSANGGRREVRERAQPYIQQNGNRVQNPEYSDAVRTGYNQQRPKRGGVDPNMEDHL